ncbi:MAG: MFS transporter [Micrococcales bacterium 73-13]|nr:MAG: MFS transporter [Micrococcales bacterium 73-13]
MPETISPVRSRLALVALVLGAAMMMLDVTIVNVALPTLRASIGADESTLSWIVSGYALASGLTLIPAGRLGDRFGHKPVFLAGIVIFTLASLWCGLAADGTQLVIARVVQGLGGGLFFPAIGAFIQLLFAGRARGKAFAVLGASIGVFTALGPLVGGVIIEAFGEEHGWRWIFFVNLPIGILALIGSIVLLPRGAEGRGERGFDGLGLAVLAVGLVAILVPLIQGEEAGWPLWTWVSIAVGLVLLVLFGWWEVRRARRDRTQIVPPRLFRHPSFTGGVVLGFVYFAAFTSIFFVIALYWQAGLGHSALESGLTVIPFSIASIIGAALSERLSRRLGRGVLVLGTACVASGYIALWLVVLLVDPAVMTNWILLAPLFVAGFGSGCFIAPNLQFIVATVDRQEAGAAQGVVNTVQRVGSAAGIAIVGAIFFGTLDTGPVAQAGPKGPDAVQAALAEAFTTSAHWALLASAIAAVAAFCLVWTLPRRVGAPGGAAAEG